MNDKLEFGSRQWVDKLSELLHDRLAGVDLAEVSGSFSEEYTDPPGHLQVDGRDTIGWCVEVADGVLAVRAEPMDADAKIVADYRTVEPLAKVVYGGNPEMVEHVFAAAKQAYKAGKLRRIGNPETDVPAAVRDALGAVHDEMAALTA